MAGANIRIAANSSDFQKQMREVTSQLKLVSSECGVATEKAKLFGNVQDKLAAAQKETTAKMQAQNQMLNLYRDRITVINADIQKHKDKQSEIASKIDETTKKYKESIEQTGKNSEASKELNKELQSLKEKYAQNEKAVESSSKKLVDATTKMNNTEISLLQNQKALENINKEISNMKLDKLSEGLDKASAASGNLSDKMKPVSTAVIGLGTASAAASITFEDSMAKVMTIADESVMSYDDMKSSIIDLSNQTGISANEIADNIYDAISAGQSTTDAVNFVSESTKLAKAGFAEAGQSLDLLTTIMNAYELEASEVNRVSDVLIQTQNKGKVTVGQLSSDMGKLIPTAKSNGVALEQVATGYALMTSKGIKSAESTTYMNSMLNELGKSGTKVSDNLKELTGQSFQDLIASGSTVGDVLSVLDENAKANGKSLSDMFGSSEAAKAAMILVTDSGNAFNEALKEMGNSVGATDKAFKTVDETTGNNLKKSLNEVKNSAINMGDTLAPVTSMIASGFSKVTGVLSKLDSTQLKTIAGIGAGIVTINLALGAFSKLTDGLSNAVKSYKDVRDFGGKAIGVIKDFGTSALNGAKAVGSFASSVGKGMVTATVNGAKAVGNLALNLGQATLEFGKTAVQAGISAAKIVGHKVATIASSIATNTMAAAQATLNFIMSLNPITLVIAGLVALGATFVVLYNKCEWFRNGVQNVLDAITGAFQKFNGFLTSVFATDWTNSFGLFGNIMNAFFQNMSNSWEAIKRVFSGIIDFVSGVFTGDWSRAWSGVVNVFGGIMDGLGAVIKAPLNGVIGLINMAIDGINKISFTAPAWIPGVGGKHFGISLPKISYLENGGILTKPTFIAPNIMAGEKNYGRSGQAEAVIPLESMYRNLRSIVREEASGETIIYTTNVFNVDGKELKRETTKEVIKNITRNTKSYRKSKGGLALG